MIEKLKLQEPQAREMVRLQLRSYAHIETTAAIRALHLRFGTHPALVAGMINACRACAETLERNYPEAQREMKR